jgi:acyl-CoA synthetase (AMP-forming)/AMP-acid ligase II
LALLTGGTLCPWNAKAVGFTGLDGWLVSQAATIFSSVPTAFRQFVVTLRDRERFPALRLVRLWGEPSFRRDFVAFQRHAPDGAALVNRIGASETGPIAWQFFDKDSVFDGNSLPVGRCTDGHAVRLLDREGREVPHGEAGEIVVFSRFLSPGYWHRDEQTRAVFRDDGDEPGVRSYSTGDMARQLPDGSLVPAGRKDHQVKIRGYRVEVDEIEQALVSIDGIDDAVVIALADSTSEPRLIAYIVASPAAAPTVTAIRQRLAAALPDYMVPAAFIRLDAFPLAANGKVARPLLPLPGRERPRLEAAYIAPITAEQAWLANLWQELLRLDQVGINDPFFELGGDSLLATQVISRVNQRNGCSVPLQVLFEHPTIATFAQHLDAIEASGTPRREPSPIRRAARQVPS